MNEERETNWIARFLSWIRELFGLGSAERPTGETPPTNEPNPPEQLPDDKISAQIRVIRNAFGGQVAVASENGTNDETLPQFLYRVGHILVPTDRVDDVHRFFVGQSGRFGEVGEVRHEVVEGVTLYSLPAAAASRPNGVLITIDEIEAALGAGTCTPDHLLYLTYGGSGLCPATEPEHPHHDRPWPHETRDTDRGQGVQIGVVDTGWWKQAAQDPDAPFLAYGVDGDAEIINPAAIHPYGGHGTFVAGVIRCRAPQAEVTIHGMLTNGGAIFESELMKELDIAVFSENPPQIVSISGGTHTYNDQPLKTFEALAAKYNLIDNDSAPLIVAAAGNDGSDSPFWPAAFDWVVGVGSLDEDDRVSDYSNYGPWVNIFALGRDHVNAYPTGTYTCYEPPNVGEVRQFRNLAKWSGTSFSTPLVSGQLAAIMSEHGVTARQAWNRLVDNDATVRIDPNMDIGKILAMDTPGE